MWCTWSLCDLRCGGSGGQDRGGCLLFCSRGLACPEFAKHVKAEVAAGFGSFVVLFGEHGSDEVNQGGSVGEGTDDAHLTIRSYCAPKDSASDCSSTECSRVRTKATTLSG